jgi:glyoxalase family protein
MSGDGTLGGLHHVTALAGAAQSNLDFYIGQWGLRLVKRSVNFDDPATHHFYYSSAAGEPGTLATFFPWGRFRPRRKGSGQIAAMAFAVPEDSIELALPVLTKDLELWRQRTEGGRVPTVFSETRLGENVLTILDPDDIAVEIVACGAPSAPRTLHSVTLCEANLEPTADLLQFLGFAAVAQAGNRTRFGLSGRPGFVDVLHEPGTERGRLGAGMIHHVAFRVADEATQLDWRTRLLARGVQVSPVKDRLYFHSIYFREPGGVLFEIATDGPGFLIDESESALGQSLCLPPWLEPIRESVEQRLSHIHPPDAQPRHPPQPR